MLVFQKGINPKDSEENLWILDKYYQQHTHPTLWHWAEIKPGPGRGGGGGGVL